MRPVYLRLNVHEIIRVRSRADVTVSLLLLELPLASFTYLVLREPICLAPARALLADFGNEVVDLLRILWGVGTCL